MLNQAAYSITCWRTTRLSSLLTKHPDGDAVSASIPSDYMKRFIRHVHTQIRRALVTLVVVREEYPLG